MLTADGTSVLIHDGEVCNYREFRQELEKDGVRFRSLGNAEFVL